MEAKLESMAAELKISTTPEQRFIDRLRAEDRGNQSTLRRNAGQTLGTARGVGWFYRLLEPDDFRNAEVYFLVATNYTIDKVAIRGSSLFGGNMGASFRQLAESDRASANVENRFKLLLDSNLDRDGTGEMAYRLRQSVKLLTSRSSVSSPINWPQLLIDLQKWNKPYRPVQKDWARKFYAPLI